MKDRRGHGNQAYLSQSDHDDMMPAKGGYTPTVEEDGASGAAPEPIKASANNPDLGEEPVEAAATTSPSAPPAAAPDAPTTPSEQDQEEPASQKSQSSQSPSSSEATGAPAAEGPAVADPSGAPSAPAAASSASGSAAPANSYAGDEMGWDAVAFAEAGGYDAVLMGALPPGMCPGEGDGQDIFVFIDELNVDIINNTLIQETEINLIADDGSVIDIGGDFTAIQTQESLIQDGPVLGIAGPNEAPFVPQDAPLIEADAAMV